MFLKLNYNPKEKKVGDCVIRALACATKQDWLKVYDDLVIIGREQYDIPISRVVIGIYLKQLGWTKNKMPKKITGDTYRRYRLSEYCDTFKPKLMIASVANHFTCVEDGTIIDLWDCGDSSMGNYWTK